MGQEAEATQRQEDPHAGCAWTRVWDSPPVKFHGFTGWAYECEHGEVRYRIEEASRG